MQRVVERFDDPRLKLISHERNAGIVGNFTRSLLGAESEFVIQLGDDDEAHPRLVEATVAALERYPSAGIAHSRFSTDRRRGPGAGAGADWLGTPRSPPLETGREFVAQSMSSAAASAARRR